MIPGSTVLLLILSNFHLQRDFHASQNCEAPGVLLQSMLGSHVQPNWVKEISAKLSIVSVPVRSAEASETTIPTAKPQYVAVLACHQLSTETGTNHKFKAPFL